MQVRLATTGKRQPGRAHSVCLANHARAMEKVGDHVGKQLGLKPHHNFAPRTALAVGHPANITHP